MADSRRYDSWQVGLAIAALPGLLFVPFLGFLMMGVQNEILLLPAWGALGIGFTQLLWVVPAAFWAGFTGRTRALVGILATAAVVFMLNGACFAIVLSTISIH